MSESAIVTTSANRLGGGASGALIAGVTRVHPAHRHGLKGAGAADWLAAHGVAVPSSPNHIARWNGGRCLRLGSTEFLLEIDDQHSPPPIVPAPSEEARAWLLLRSDHSLVLEGAHWPARLAHLCSFDFTRLHAAPDSVVMTLLAGISVTIAREPAVDAEQFALRLWCDASYATYLDQCLQTLADPRPFGEQR